MPKGDSVVLIPPGDNANIQDPKTRLVIEEKVSKEQISKRETRESTSWLDIDERDFQSDSKWEY